MSDLIRYPKLNDKPHERPILSMYGKNLWGEFIWLAIPVVVVLLALLLR